MKKHITAKKEGTWTNYLVVDKKGIVRFTTASRKEAKIQLKKLK